MLNFWIQNCPTKIGWDSRAHKLSMRRVSSWVLWACCAKSLWIAFGKDEVLDWLLRTTLILLLICSSFRSENCHPVLIYSSLSTAQYTLGTREYHKIGTELKLVGGWTTPLKNISQNWISPGRGEHKKYLKPPPRKSNKSQKPLKAAFAHQACE